MEALVLAGKARSIGVSNFFTQEELEEVLAKQVDHTLSIQLKLTDVRATIIPAVNQVLLHPYRQNNEFLGWCSSKVHSFPLLPSRTRV